MRKRCKRTCARSRDLLDLSCFDCLLKLLLTLFIASLCRNLCDLQLRTKMSETKSPSEKTPSSPSIADRAAPGSSLSDAIVTPKMLTENLRAGLFPHLSRSVTVCARVIYCKFCLIFCLQSGIRSSLTQQALDSVELMEKLHRSSCPNSVLKRVDVVDIQQSSLPWGFFQRGAKLVAAERWTVHRCGVQQTYRINFYRGADGDSFFARVSPTNASGAVDFARVKWQQTLRDYGF